MNYLLSTYPYRGLVLVKGEGNYLIDSRGRRFLDCMTNYGVSIFGYSQPTLIRTLQDQLQQLAILHGSFANPLRLQAARQLVQRCGGRMAQAYFANSGTEAVEAALKFAVLASGCPRVIAMNNGYHGKTLGSLAVTANPKYRQGLDQLLWQVEFVEYGNIEQLAAKLSQPSAAVILEPIQGEGGVIMPPAGYLRAVRQLCDKHNSLFIADEIQTGGGRTGRFLASQHASVEPDIICLGKGIGGGIPIGATLVSESVAAKLLKGSQTSTFGGNPLACRGILTTLELLTPARLQRITKLGISFYQQLAAIRHSRLIAVRGQGLMLGVEIRGNRDQVLKKMQSLGVLACPAGEQVVRFLPPYTITTPQIRKAIEALARSL